MSESLENAETLCHHLRLPSLKNPSFLAGKSFILLGLGNTILKASPLDFTQSHMHSSPPARGSKCPSTWAGLPILGPQETAESSRLGELMGQPCSQLGSVCKALVSKGTRGSGLVTLSMSCSLQDSQNVCAHRAWQSPATCLHALLPASHCDQTSEMLQGCVEPRRNEQDRSLINCYDTALLPFTSSECGLGKTQL